MNTSTLANASFLPCLLASVLLLLGLSASASPTLARDMAQGVSSGYEDAYGALEWRNVGPVRGGRSIAAAGSSARPLEAYFGATGGGLWKTTDAGMTWAPVTDGQIASSSVGAVAVAPSNPDIVYLGMGEGQLRNNIMQGDGVYKSEDGGETWSHIGLENTKTVATIRVHPRNPDIVYAAALGDPFAPNEERGVYMSRNGGETWKKVLYRSPEAGAIDIAMDPNNPDRLFATIWQVYRKPWKLWSGGPQSGLFLSEDGGESWTEITRRPGLPEGVIGKMTVAVSGADSNRVYANIEAKEGGLYRSDDGGETWRYINGAKKLWQRSFYFMQVRADPVDRDKVYVLGFLLERSLDGGETFTSVPTRHVDIHDLWIDSENPDRMIVADDGGGSVTLNGGRTWTEQDYPTAQIYRVSLTNDYPYHICGAQQDNTTICVASRTRADIGVSVKDRYSDHYTIGFSEMGYVGVHPKKNGVFFVGATNSLMRYDRERERITEVNPFPYIVMGQPASSMTERWNWTYPIVFSPLAPHSLYAGSQHLWKSDDEGQNWRRISPDLTRADPATLGDTGGPIMLDQDGPEVYGTLYTIAPSHFDRDVIWAGSDDGLVHVTRDGGRNWVDATPEGLPPNSRISYIDASLHEPGVAYVAVKRYEMGDRAPYAYKTADFGETWVRIDETLPTGDFVHTIREDPVRAGLLYLGTEHGVYVSFDDGQVWRPLSLNLPDVHVSGLEIKEDELIAATHGRSFYVLEGLSLLRQLASEGSIEGARLFTPALAVRRVSRAKVYAWLPEGMASARLDVLDRSGEPVRTLFDGRDLEPGAHRFIWDLHFDGAAVFEGMILESDTPAIGPAAVPDQYTVRLVSDDASLETKLELRLDPRLEGEVSRRDLRRQLALAVRARDAVDAANRTVIEIRDIRRRLSSLEMWAGAGTPDRREAYIEAIGSIEAELYQVKNESPKDKIALPIQLNDRLAGLLAMLKYSDGPPTTAQADMMDRLEAELNDVLERYETISANYADIREAANIAP